MIIAFQRVRRLGLFNGLDMLVFLFWICTVFLGLDLVCFLGFGSWFLVFLDLDSFGFLRIWIGFGFSLAL